jgi:hypothetical protein
MNDKQIKLNRLKDLAEILDSKKSGTTELVLLKKINDLKDEISQIQIPRTDLAPIEESLNRLFKDIKSVSKDTQYTQDYFKKEISTLRNALADLKAQKPTVVDKVIEKTEVIREIPFVDAPQIATEASKMAYTALLPKIPTLIPPDQGDVIIEKINLDNTTLIKREKVEGLDELERKADFALSRPLTVMGGGSEVLGIKGGTNVTVDKRGGIYTINSTGGGASDHNDLNNIQGGTTDEYYHLTEADYNDLGDLLHPYVAASAVLSTTPATGLREFGNTATDVALSAVTTKGTNNITSVKFYRGATLIETVASPIAGGGTETFTDTTDLETTTSYTCKVSDGTQEVTSNTKTFTFLYPYLYGVDDPDKPASEMYADFTKSITASGTKTFAFSPSTQVMYFCYPASYGALSSIKDPNLFETISDWTLRTENITGLDGNAVSYNIYEFLNLTSQSGFLITFIL